MYCFLPYMLLCRPGSTCVYLLLNKQGPLFDTNRYITLPAKGEIFLRQPKYMTVDNKELHHVTEDVMTGTASPPAYTIDPGFISYLRVSAGRQYPPHGHHTDNKL